jgi:hypothetical protein
LQCDEVYGVDSFTVDEFSRGGIDCTSAALSLRLLQKMNGTNWKIYRAILRMVGDMDMYQVVCNILSIILSIIILKGG